MKKIFTSALTLGVLNLILNSTSLAQQTAPTKASKPLPTIAKTHNVDTVLSEQVQNLLTKLPILKNQSVSAGSHDGIITLEGTVDNQAQADAAIKAAKSVKGVKAVKSDLTIKLTPTKIAK